MAIYSFPKRTSTHPRGAIQTLVIWLALGAAFTSSWTGIRIAGINVADCFLAAASFLAVLVAVSKGGRLPIYGWATLPPVALLFIAAIDSIVRGNPLWSHQIANEWAVGSAVGVEQGGAIPLILRMLLAMTAVAIVVASVADNDDGDALVRKIIYTWAAGAAVGAVYAVAASSPLGKSLALGDLPFVYYVASETRATGLAYHPNSLGQSIAVALPVLIYLIGTTRGLANVATIAVVPISLYAIILSGSRAAVLLGAVLTVVTLTYLVKATKRIRIWVVPAIILSGMLSTSIAQKLIDKSRFDERSTYFSDTIRRASIQSGIALFESNPLFGAGVGSWNAEMVLLIVLTSGGLIYFTIFYGSLIRPLIMRTRSSGNSLEVILTISAIGVLAFGLLNGSIVERYLYWPFVALFALRLSARPEQRGSASVS